MFLITAKFLGNHRVSLSEIISWLQPSNLDFLGASESSRILISTSSTLRQPTSGFETIIQRLKGFLDKDSVSKLYILRYLKVPSWLIPALKRQGLRLPAFSYQIRLNIHN